MEPSTQLILASKHLVLPQTTETLTPGLVFIKEGFIEKVVVCSLSDWEDHCQPYKGKPHFYFLPEQIISPAFINSHTHIAMNFFRQFPVEDSTAGNMVENLFFHLEKHLLPEDVLAFSRIGAVENILSGVGLIWDHYYFGLSVAQACAEVGLGAVVASTLQDRGGPHPKLWEEGLTDADTLQSGDWRKKQIYPALGPHASDTVSADLWTQIIDLAKERNWPLHFHLSQSKEEVWRSFSQHGATPVSWLNSLGLWQESLKCLAVHGVYFNQQDLSYFNPENHTLGFCPFSQMIFAHPAPVWHWERQGIPWCVGTDCVASNDSMNLQKELRFIGGLARIRETFSTEQTDFFANSEFLKSAKESDWLKPFAPCQGMEGLQDSASWLLSKVWQIPGRMHPQFETGALEVGYLANIAVWDGSHPSLWPAKRLRGLAMGDSTGALLGMIVGGKILGLGEGWQRDYLLRISYPQLVVEANSRLNELIKRSGLGN